MTAPSTPASRQILGLDLIRFAAALLVVTYHFGFMFWVQHDPAGYLLRLPHPPSDRAPSVWFGFVGVQLFFVISGFVITYSAHASDGFSFFRDRLVRLWPALWICATISLVAFLYFDIAVGSRLERYLREITFYPFEPWLDVVVWTLGVEIAFYTVIFVLVCLKRLRWIAGVAAVMACASLLFHSIITVQRCDWALQCENWSRADRLASLLLLDHGCFFAIGIFLWLWLVKKEAPARSWWIMPALAAAVLQIFGVAGYEHMKGGFVGFEGAMPAWIPIVVWLCGLLAIALSVSFNATLRHLGPGFARAFRTIGLSTYPLYLLHFVSGGVIAWALVRVGVDLDRAIVGAAVGVIIASVLIATLLEPPLQAALRFILDRLGALLRSHVPAVSFLFKPGAPASSSGEDQYVKHLGSIPLVAWEGCASHNERGVGKP